MGCGGSAAKKYKDVNLTEDEAQTLLVRKRLLKEQEEEQTRCEKQLQEKVRDGYLTEDEAQRLLVRKRMQLKTTETSDAIRMLRVRWEEQEEELSKMETYEKEEEEEDGFTTEEEEKLAKMDTYFLLWDTNHDGFIDPNELEIGMASLGFDPKPEEIQKMMAEADCQLPGHISRDECMRMLTAKLSGNRPSCVLAPEGLPVHSKDHGSLYLGACQAAVNANFLKGANIAVVVNASCNFFKGSELFESDAQLQSSLGIEKILLEWEDSETQVLGDAELVNACERVDEALAAGRSVFVHCAQGRSRSSTVVVAYLVAKHGMSADEALRFVQSKRGMAQPNPNFMKQLNAMEPMLKNMFKTGSPVAGD